ncbi:hypothetical protein PIB30_047038 [Stylosanthes scabra]|uniref:Ribonuclease H1 N-terminal domain-containing protein n=1 Tax=Stylosanthes scabra TaxID=79078 RepID=A0ABU6RHD9_9FABA|nr:hypothetical protein [Stylosanthes scabra]
MGGHIRETSRGSFVLCELASANFALVMMEEGKYSHYAVRVGRVNGIYTSWGDCAPNVLGFPRAQFKGFKSLEEALKYMQKGKEAKGKMVGSSSSGMENLSRQMSTLHEEYVPQTQGGGFLIVEDMELYLLRACRTLEAGFPCFERRVFYDSEGLRHYAFKAALQCELKRIDMQADNFFCPDEGRAREDAAYKLLDKLLIQTGYSICDFNYRRLCLAQ